ncbi:hypothetical protein A3B02_00740 [Candidatus Roizmanbacteria bacterium RIFCSPLOWO2_01_FULL_42_14]|uniref:Uncharacterized protein n=4 Tax=Candidatus Roizmaniibacteriota TaxID=1752723 RepID=A0A1F7K1X1_9BACT|nr:MAG: hypothetical protein A3D08_01565 [Candidatus Roizmanbacteria bacterium RIFCSPHIGHO2_02_FULL_43_11]OGK38838.1 MAG: hypothetical protein A3F32_02040 [Candidatus Roizmanbacteria bacterium RIFCSPHIGHO2_12_FULL_42_10]OGK52609.1 MAG: hypothetical protein A3B02_00740 [Candidatus Roizmanbacteria bacterium RIFCSPLOWO2_01_FULL_42_14]OGK61861.1 MAG: hypothetical protein A3I56_02770 [Candidatus Roizmanbacteria bacterium RIFCSPLOWO2_02_FULL_43_10]
MFSLLAQTTDENVKKVFGEGIKDVPLSGGSVGETFSQVFGFLINVVLAVAAITVLVILLWGALDYITSGGDSQKLSKAVQKIVSALVGIIVLIAVFIIWVFLGTHVFRVINNEKGILQIKLPSIDNKRPPVGGGGDPNNPNIPD